MGSYMRVNIGGFMPDQPAVEIHRTPVNIETEEGFAFCWTPVIDGKVLENPNNPDRLFGSIKSAKKGAAKHLGVNVKSLAVKVIE